MLARRFFRRCSTLCTFISYSLFASAIVLAALNLVETIAVSWIRIAIICALAVFMYGIAAILALVAIDREFRAQVEQDDEA